MTEWSFNDLIALEETLAGVAGRVLPEVTTAIDKGGKKIEKRAKELVSKRSRRTERSIKSDLVVTAGGAEVSAEIGPTTFYGPLLEHGTAKMSARPFMGPAADQLTDEIADDILNAAAKKVLE